MSKEPLPWQKITEKARELGAGEWAIRKWAQRGNVPAKWRIDLARELRTTPERIAPVLEPAE